MLWGFLLLQLLMAFGCVTGLEKQRRIGLSGSSHVHGVRLHVACSPIPFAGTVTPLRLSGAHLAGCSSPEQCPSSPLAVLLPALLAVASCQTHPLPSASFSSAGSEHLSCVWLY